jgi:RNA polymerase sigma factor (sigma-70 family)
MSWRPAAEAACRRHGFPPRWVESFAGGVDVLPSDPRDAARAFEGWCMERLASIWSGATDEPDLDGNLAAYLVHGYLASSARVLAWRYRLAPEEWDDLVGAAAERALRVFSERAVAAPQGYLFRTLERAIWEYLRKARREVPTAAMPTAADAQPNPERVAADRQLIEALRRCYAELDPEDARMFEALEVDGRSAAEVGAPRGLSANAVNVRKFRIRRRLKACMQARTGLDDPFDGAGD